MAYTQSMVYFKSGGTGRMSSLAVAAFTTLLFFIGPQIASYLPRCMAGTLLLHCGVDLFLEGVYDSFGKYDSEYAVSLQVFMVKQNCSNPFHCMMNKMLNMEVSG
jgi:MFS superfamily sulfate permease-like transporter